MHSAWLAARTGGANRSWGHNAPVACSEALFRRRLARRNPAAGASTRVGQLEDQPRRMRRYALDHVAQIDERIDLQVLAGLNLCVANC